MIPRPARRGTRAPARGLAPCLGGWLLLFNAAGGGPYAPTQEWDEVRRYDTAWECEAGRREEAARVAEKQAEEHQGSDSRTTLDALLQHRCEYEGRARHRRRWFDWW